MSQPVVLTVGHVTHDRYGDDLVAGGCAYYGAHTHRALGAGVRLVTMVGEDFACNEALADFPAEVRREGRTTLFTNLYPEAGGRVQRLEAQAPPILPGDLPPAWRRCELLHLAPVMGEVDLAGWIRAVDARMVGIGVQGWIKAAGPGTTVAQRPWEVDRATLAGVHAACVGEEDLREQGDLLDRLVEAVPVVALTHGRNGCDVIVRGKTTGVGVYPAREIDPTGAGDVFAAGFLLALARGASPVEAARLGAAAASIVVEGRAGDTLPRIAESLERIDLVPPRYT